MSGNAVIGEPSSLAEYLLSVMGHPKLERCVGEQRKPVHLSGMNLTLIVLLAMHTRHDGLSRETIAELIWPEAQASKANSCLSSALLRLRKSLGGAPLITQSHGSVGLVRDGLIDVDYWILDGLVARLRRQSIDHWIPGDINSLDLAMQARRGGFLDGIPGDWVVSARQACADIYGDALEYMMRFYRFRGQHNDSIAAAKKLVRQDPYREDIHAALIDLYGAKGRPAQAIRQFESCRTLLKSELDVEPGPELQRTMARALPQSTEMAKDLVEMIGKIDRSMEELRRQVEGLRDMVEQQRWLAER